MHHQSPSAAVFLSPPFLNPLYQIYTLIWSPPSCPSEQARVFQFLGMWPYLILVVIYTLSNLSSRLLNMIRILTLQTICSEDSLTNSTSLLSEKHRLSNSSVGKIQLLCNINSMSFQTDSISKLFHHLQHVLVDKISSSEDRNYLSLQRTKNTGTIRASTLTSVLGTSSRPEREPLLLYLQSYISDFVTDFSV